MGWGGKGQYGEGWRGEEAQERERKESRDADALWVARAPRNHTIQTVTNLTGQGARTRCLWD